MRGVAYLSFYRFPELEFFQESVMAREVGRVRGHMNAPPLLRHQELRLLVAADLRTCPEEVVEADFCDRTKKMQDSG